MLELRYLDKQDGTRILEYRDFRCDETGRDLSTPWQEPIVETEAASSYEFVLYSENLGYISEIQQGLGGSRIMYDRNKSYAKKFKEEHEARVVMEKNNLSLWDYLLEKVKE